MPLTALGKVVRLQIQRSSLTIGERPNRSYDPTPLLATPSLTIGTQGATMATKQGVTLDLHHAQHPQTHHSGSGNPLSFNFTSHYAAMRAEYGEHVWDGCAGENILIETTRHLALEQFANGVAIQPHNGGALIWLQQVLVAHPCRPFSGYVLKGTEATVKEALQFLDAGMRGFYCTLTQAQKATLSVGDEVLV